MSKKSYAQKSDLLVIVGPTASGKSALAVKLAKKLNGEVISADSRQIYRGLNIGTGKITAREMHGVRHHLLDVADPRKRFSVHEYRKLASNAIIDIHSRGKLPIICGGTGLYVDSLLTNVSFPPIPANDMLRRKLNNKSAPELLVMLAKIDPRRARTIGTNHSDRHNPRRLIRAIEIATAQNLQNKKVEGKSTYSAPETAFVLPTGDVAKARQSLRPQYSAIWIGLNPPRDVLRKRIHDRLLSRLDQGLVREVRKLHRLGLSWARMEQLGLEYRYVSRYLQGQLKYDQMVSDLETAICQYGKRQITWFGRNKEIKWFIPNSTLTNTIYMLTYSKLRTPK